MKNGLRAVFLLMLLAVSTSVFAQDGAAVEQKIDQLIQQMTLKEKVNMIHATSSFTSGGVERLGIPELIMSDGPHGVRFEHGRDWVPDADADDDATYLPTGITLASTWNPGLGYAFGTVLGSEARNRGKDVILGPAINIIRTPLNGRNFEYMSEDPYLVSQMAPQYVKGVQEQDVAVSVKHYIANNQEIDRNTINVEMSERALREIYLPGFKAAVENGGALTVMGSYNKFRGQYATENEYLMNDVLKGDFGFKGLVMSDWGAVHNTMDALKNGNDIEMGTDLNMLPNPDYSKFYLADTVVTLVNNGMVDEQLVNDKVRRILRVMFAVHKLGDGARKQGERNTKAHQETARKVAEEGIVLLKNEGLLPLQPASVKQLAVIGANADRKFGGLGGSSQVPAKYEVTPLQGLKNQLGNGVKIQYAPGYKIAKGQKADASLINEAVSVAKKADAVVLVGGWIHGFSPAWNDNAYDAEGADKPDMQLPFGQNELIKAVVEANPNTVIVMMGGGPVDMTSWIAQTKGLIQAWYPGMEGGNALAEIILGKVNPSGKLPMTFPKKLEDVPAHSIGEYPGKFGIVHYNEGIFNGYRYYDTFGVQPQFSFGHGLSYTSFEYENLEVVTNKDQATVRLTVKNTGKRAGKEVVQVYVNDEEASVRRPAKELKGFAKVELQPGEQKQVELTLPAEAFKYYDGIKRQWVLEPGAFKVLVGSSSSDIRLSKEIKL